jgi:hypothetical protein
LEDNIKWIFERLGGGGGADWIDLTEGRDRWRALVYTVMNLRVPKNAGSFLSSLGHFSFSGRTLLHGVTRFMYLTTCFGLNKAILKSSTGYQLLLLLRY